MPAGASPTRRTKTSAPGAPATRRSRRSRSIPRASTSRAPVGTQYRSAIFYHSPEQKATAERVIAELQAQKLWDEPVVTELKPLTAFYPAEEYHRDYFRRNPTQGYCQAVIAPKVAKVRKLYFDRLKQPA